jgi:hypothetical protein
MRWIAALIALATATAALALLTGVFEMASRYEEPAYTVTRTTPEFEVRAYAPTIEAQVTMPGTYSQAVTASFRVLAGYIFGGNAPRSTIAMTTPVSASPVSEPIAMTTPVSAVQGVKGWTVSFTMPSDKTLATLPIANDPRVRLVAMPGKTWVVRKFRGRATDKVVAGELATLQRDAVGGGLHVLDVSVVSQFNPPWVLGPWRRNEVRWLLAD